MCIVWNRGMVTAVFPVRLRITTALISDLFYEERCGHHTSRSWGVFGCSHVLPGPEIQASLSGSAPQLYGDEMRVRPSLREQEKRGHFYDLAVGDRYLQTGSFNAFRWARNQGYCNTRLCYEISWVYSLNKREV
ncbi:hypothetical protein RRG08_032037 [Elysia crispata]|uniref:Uncharacterized protein n=1 Tax=Elysia crispata TaxID=231223 RepID=A0AAE0XVZ6_9GAST|nr:hypothetical protein RRG08_032037 [Elysia crispata]